ncbi:MAG: hypothetical protein ACXWPM_10210 [Bdellovibrionota bacterium]
MQKFAIFLAITLIALGLAPRHSGAADADEGDDGMIQVDPKGCGPGDPNCTDHLGKIEGQIQIAPLSFEAGVRIGSNGTTGVVRFSTKLGGFEARGGNLDIITFEALYVPGEGGFRVRFNLADSQVLFFCEDKTTGHTHPPLAGIFSTCKPTGVIGLGGNLLQLQADTDTHRWAARWAELNVVFNFLANGNSRDFLHKSLMGYIGASAETIWPGTTPGVESPGATSLARLNLGITGMIKSENNHWELRGYAGFRPSVVEWDDWAVEARVTTMYHLLLTKNEMATIGIDVDYSHWNIPEHSIGTFASDREKDSLYIGAMFGWVW